MTSDGADPLSRMISTEVAELAGAPALAGRVRTFHWQGAEMVSEDFGAGDETFVLVHGIGMGRTVFAELIEDLKLRGRVIAIDQPGYGESAEPPRTPTMQRTADILAALLREHGYSAVTAIGHSMGAQVVAELAVRHPQLVSSLVLIAPTVDETGRKAIIQFGRLLQDLWGESPKVIILGAREYLRSGPHVLRKMRAMIQHEPEKIFPRITQPTLVLRGEDDRVVPDSWARRTASLIPDAVYDTLPQTSHQSMIRYAAPTTARIVRFLRRQRN